MSTFPNSARLLKGGIVSSDVATLVRRIIVFQYNPEKGERVDYENAILNPQLHEQITCGNGWVYSW
jgi:hypothetical protein